MNNFKTICSEYGIKATTVRRQLYELFRQNSPILAAEFINLAKSQGFDTVTIYRTINLFSQIGIIYEFGSGKQRTLQLQVTNHHSHHHYIRCQSCNKVVRFEDAAIEKKLLDISVQNGFVSVDSHFLEIIGVCFSCNQLSRTA